MYIFISMCCSSLLCDNINVTSKVKLCAYNINKEYHCVCSSMLSATAVYDLIPFQQKGRLTNKGAKNRFLCSLGL